MRPLPAPVLSGTRLLPSPVLRLESGLPAERWGWQLRAPPVRVPEPFTTEPPGLPVVDLAWLTRLARQRDRAVRTRRRWFIRTVSLAGLAALAWVLDAWLGGPVHWIAAGVTLAAVGFAALSVRPSLLSAYADVRYRRWRRGVVERLPPLAERARAWAEAREAHERRQQPEAPQWEPVRPASAQRVDVYGGSADDWTALLSTAVSSMTATGIEVTVVDLSQDGVGQRLDAGVRVRLPEQLAGARLLHGLDAADLAAVISEVVAAVDRDDSHRTVDSAILEQLLGCLSDSRDGSERGESGGANESAGGDERGETEDGSKVVVGDGIAGSETAAGARAAGDSGSGDAPAVGDGRAVSFGRLHAAVRVVARMEGRPEELAPGEYRALVELFGEAGRRTAEPRLFRLAAVLRQLAAMEAGSDQAPVPAADQLLVWELSEQVTDLGGDLLAQVAAQVLLLRLRHSTSPQPAARCLVVVGADRLRRAVLERLDQLTRRRRVRLVLCSRHLRDDAVEVLGSGDAVMFMRLGNAREAEYAATFIGREHRLVASQFTASRSVSGSVTHGGSTSRASSEQESTTDGAQSSRTLDYDRILGLFDLPYDSDSGSRGTQRSTTVGTSTSLTEGTSWSDQVGRSASRSVSYQRVYEYAVTPKFLQDLSPTAFILVDPADPESPQLGDCGIDPWSATGSDPPNHTPPKWIW